MKSQNRKTLRRIELLPAAIVSPFLILFLFVAVSRITLPYEIEWNEGQSAEQAFRFATGQTLYPSPDSGWVPYMYAPGYHVLWGTVMRVANSISLGWGRWISLLASLSVGIACLLIVLNGTRHLAISIFAGLLWFAFFAPSGFWFDVARGDSLALALGMWGLYFVLKKRPSPWEVVLGFLFLWAAVWTKQTFGLAAVFAGVYALIRALPAAKIMSIVVVILSLNVWLLFDRSGSTHLLHYVFQNALKHESDWSVVTGNPSRIHADLIRPIWPLLLVLTVGLIGAIKRKRLPKWWPWLCVLALFTAGSVSSYAKFGGYRNNLMPVFAGISVVAGFTFAQIFRSTPSATMRVLTTWTLAGALVVTIVQPWLFTTNDQRGRYLYNPSAQIGSSEGVAAHQSFSAWLSNKAELEESVLCLHHPYYALMNGHRIGVNFDMVRVATWAYQPPSPATFRDLWSGEYDWIVLDRHPLSQEWVLPEITETIREDYQYIGTLDEVLGIDMSSIAPMTGAAMFPRHLYQLRPELQFDVLFDVPREPLINSE